MAALKWARQERPGLGVAATAVLKVLADHANDAATCWPSVAQIALEAGCCTRTVRYALRRLEAEKLIGTRRTGRGNRYLLALPSLAAQSGKSCSSELQEMPIRAAALAPKALKKPQEAIGAGAHAPETEPRQNAAAYKRVAHDLPAELDPDVMAEMRAWLQANQ